MTTFVIVKVELYNIQEKKTQAPKCHQIPEHLVLMPEALQKLTLLENYDKIPRLCTLQYCI